MNRVPLRTLAVPPDFLPRQEPPRSSTAQVLDSVGDRRPSNDRNWRRPRAPRTGPSSRPRAPDCRPPPSCASSCCWPTPCSNRTAPGCPTGPGAAARQHRREARRSSPHDQSVGSTPLRIGFQAAEDQAKCTSVCGRARSAVAELTTTTGICPSVATRGAVRGSMAAGRTVVGAGACNACSGTPRCAVVASAAFAWRLTTSMSMTVQILGVRHRGCLGP